MADHKFNKDAGAALVFALLYGALFVWMLQGYIVGRYKIRSRWSLLFFHVTIRVASQALGIAFGILGFDNTDVFIAYLILGAEGYFTLTIAAYLFLKSWQKHNWGDSWLASDKHDDGQTGSRRVAYALLLAPLFTPWRYKHHVMAPIHSLLIPANAIIITGGSYLAGSTPDEPDYASKLNTAKILRSIGSGVFLAVTLIFNACLVITYITNKRKIRNNNAVSGREGGKYASISNSSEARIHPTLPILSVVGSFLIVRGVFGLLQSAVWSLSYVNPENYTSGGFTSRFIAIEYCLTVLPEFASAALMNLTYFTAKQDRYAKSSDIPVDIEDVQVSDLKKSVSEV